MGIIHDMNSLINGELRDIEPTGPHETVAGSIACLIYVEIFCSNFNWLVPETCLIKSLYADVTALRPDVVVLDKAELGSKPLWQKEPVICKDSTISLLLKWSSLIGKIIMQEMWKNTLF